MNGVNELSAKPPPAWLKVLQYPPVRLLLLGGPLFYFGLGHSNAILEKYANQFGLRLALVVGLIILAFAFYAAFVRFIERRPVSELAPGPLLREMGIGLVIGALLYAFCVAILMALGIFRIEGFNPVAVMVPAIPWALSSGFFEELIFRGALFRIVEEWLGSWVSLAASSFLFGFLHLTNPDATLTGAIFITVEAGILLAAAYMLTRRLWMSIGFHAAWNYTQSAVFSGEVSGSAASTGLIRPVIEGPVLLTGGQFGIEASLTAFVLCTAMGVFLLVKAMRRGHVVPAPWQRPS